MEYMTLSEARYYVAPDPLTETELQQLRSVNMQFRGVPSYRDVSMVEQAVCDTGLNLCKQTLRNHTDWILQKGMIFNTMTELKLFLENYAVHHHRPYTVSHSDISLRYHVKCLSLGCPWRLNARKRTDDKWRISKVVQPHTCFTNKGQEKHPQLTARYLARRILAFVDDDADVSVSQLMISIFRFTGYKVTYGKVRRAKQIALAIRWGG